MRTIKFRAWDKVEKRYAYFKLVNGIVEWLSSFLSEDINRGQDEQFTGLLDKNGVEVFEGDVAAIDEPQVKFKVVFEDGAFIFKGKYTFFPLHEAEFFEVIGNIFQHPHLLEANHD